MFFGSESSKLNKILDSESGDFSTAAYSVEIIDPNYNWGSASFRDASVPIAQELNDLRMKKAPKDIIEECSFKLLKLFFQDALGKLGFNAQSAEFMRGKEIEETRTITYGGNQYFADDLVNQNQYPELAAPLQLVQTSLPGNLVTLVGKKYLLSPIRSFRGQQGDKLLAVNFGPQVFIVAPK